MYHDDVEYRRAENARHKENSARLATAYAVYTTSGQGSLELEQRCDFGVTFIEKPRPAYGAELDLDELGDLQDVAGGETPIIPHCTGYVTDWDQDDRGFYTGCWVAVRVSFPAEDLVDVTLQVPMVHTWTFTAVAMKDVPIDVRD